MNGDLVDEFLYFNSFIVGWFARVMNRLHEYPIFLFLDPEKSTIDFLGCKFFFLLTLLSRWLDLLFFRLEPILLPMTLKLL